MNRKLTDPFRYYSGIIEFLSEHFPGVFFEYKLQKKMQNDEDYLDPSKKKSKILKMIKKGLVLCYKQIFGGK